MDLICSPERVQGCPRIEKEIYKYMAQEISRTLQQLFDIARHWIHYIWKIIYQIKKSKKTRKQKKKKKGKKEK